ncbi:MAG: response regulator [Oscillospiraceae bacterium]
MYILAVDDEHLSLKSLENELNKVFPGSEIHCERKPNEAIKWVQSLGECSDELRYAFLDIQMRGLNGLELARQLKKICPNITLIFCTAYSEYAIDAFGLFAKGYLLKPVRAEDIRRVLDEMVTDWRSEQCDLPRDIRMHTFGNFEVMVDGKALRFERRKAKELLAFLVDRHGASVTTKEISAILWEDAPYDSNLKNKTTSIIASLRKTLSSAGIGDILIKGWNQLALDVTKIKCDAYDYENMDVVAINSFHGEYMVEYSWAEFTTGKYSQMYNE